MLPSLVTLLLLALAAPAPGPAAAAEIDGRFGPYLDTRTGLDEPRGLAFLPDGRRLVVERGAHRIAVLSPEGVVVARWGHGPGTELGAFDRPSAVAVAPDGAVFVADTGNHRIQELSPDGAPRRAWGGPGDGPSATGGTPDGLAAPLGVAVHDDRVYVADTGNHRIAVFDRDGQLVQGIGERGASPEQLLRPSAVVVDPQGRLWIADAGNHRIVRLLASGSPDGTFGEWGPFPGLLAEPTGLAWHAGRLYVADRDNHRIQVLDADGALLYEWGKHARAPGQGMGHLHYPDAVAVAPDGSEVLVAESFVDRIQRFGPANGPAALYAADPALVSGGATPHYGPVLAASDDLLALLEPETQAVLVFTTTIRPPVMIGRFGGRGPQTGRFLGASDVSFDASASRLLVADRDARRIQSYHIDRTAADELRFDPTLGHLVRSIDLVALLAAQGVEASQVEPVAVAQAEDGRTWVADALGRRVLAFDGRWRATGTVVDGLDVVDMVVDRERGELWVVDGGRRELVAFDAEGREAQRWGGPATFVEPAGVAIGADGTVYVTDAGADRVLRFAPDGTPGGGWGHPGLGPGGFSRPRGIACLADGTVVVVDHGNHRAQLFTRDGSYLQVFGSRLYVREARRGDEG